MRLGDTPPLSRPVQQTGGVQQRGSKRGRRWPPGMPAIQAHTFCSFFSDAWTSSLARAAAAPCSWVACFSARSSVFWCVRDCIKGEGGGG